MAATSSLPVDSPLLQQALTHRSAGQPNNERLEFLGDALVGLYAAEMLFEAFPGADEGELSRRRASLVRESSLAELARARRIGEQLRLGSGEMKTGGWRRDSILADAYEALVAALFLEQGHAVAKAFVLADMKTLLADQGETPEFGKDPKTRLQEWLQQRQLPLPNYDVVDVFGEEHARTFVARCTVTSRDLQAEDSGSSRKVAEQRAAAAILHRIHNEGLK